MHRPTAVTLLGVFDIVSGFAGLAMGGLTIVSGLNASDGSRLLLVYGAILCAGGILYLVAGRGRYFTRPGVWRSKHQEYAAPSCLVDPASCGDSTTDAFLARDPATGDAVSGYFFGFAKRAATSTASDDRPLDLKTATPEQVIAFAARSPARRQADAIAARGGYAFWAVPVGAGRRHARELVH